jgi:hypothetical protein
MDLGWQTSSSSRKPGQMMKTGQGNAILPNEENYKTDFIKEHGVSFRSHGYLKVYSVLQDDAKRPDLRLQTLHF